MDIGAISSNTLIQQISGIQTGRQIHHANPTEDANLNATLASSQKIDAKSVRSVEQGSEGSKGEGVKDEKQLEERIDQRLDVFA